MKILIVDDNEDITDMLTKYLNMSGHDCYSSNDGRNALNLMENGNYDVVLLDLSMPNFSGVDIIDDRALKNKISEMKIVIFTASSISNSEIDELIKKGAHSCIKKPIDPDELVQYIENINAQKLRTYN